MFHKDEFGRTWLDGDTFLAPFGYYKEDYNFVIEYLRDPYIAKKTYFDGFDEGVVLEYYSHYLKSGFGWIGFHKKQRIAFLFLETVSFFPLIYAVHGGLVKKLFGKGLGTKSLEFVKQFVFDGMEATKLEGYVLKPNNLIAGYYERGGLTKECEIQGRISVDGKLLPSIIYSLSKEEYFNKEKKDGRRISTKRAKPGRSSGSTNSRSKGRTRKNKASKRRGRKSFSKRKRNNR